jgi:hypothetical protein
LNFYYSIKIRFQKNKMSFKIIILFGLATLIAEISCQACSYEADIDYFGNDLNTNFIYFPTQDLCCAACAYNSSCQASLS